MELVVLIPIVLCCLLSTWLVYDQMRLGNDGIFAHGIGTTNKQAYSTR